MQPEIWRNAAPSFWGRGIADIESGGAYQRQPTELDAVRGWVLELDGVIQRANVAPEFKALWRSFVDEVECIVASAGHCASWSVADEYRRRVGDWLQMFAAELLDVKRPRGQAAPANKAQSDAGQIFSKVLADEKIKDRYKDATDYVRRAFKAIEPAAWELWEKAAFEVKTAPARGELQRLEARWSRATSDKDRAGIMRDAELLADRVQENLPGAPQDRRRTDLYEGEVQRATPGTSYWGEIAGAVGLPGNNRKADWGRLATVGLASAGVIAILASVLRR